MRRTPLIPLALCLVSGLALADPPRRPAPEGEARLGLVFSETGAAGVYGTSQRQGAQLAVDVLNGGAGPSDPLLEPLFRDDATDAETAVKHVKKLSRSDKARLLLGPTLSSIAFAADPIAQHDGIPVLGVSNTAEGITAIGDFVFRDSLTEAVVIPNAVSVVHGISPLASAGLIYQTGDAYTLGAAQAFRDAAAAEGIPLVIERTFAAGDTDFTAQLTAIRSEGVGALFIASFAAQGAAIVRQVRDLAFPATTAIVGGNGLNVPAFLTAAASAAEGVYVGAAWNPGSSLPASQAFVSAFVSRYGSLPDQFAAQAYAGVELAFEAFRRAGPGAGGRALRDALATIEAFPTVLGPFSFTAGRDADHPPVVQVVQGGVFVLEGAGNP